MRTRYGWRIGRRVQIVWRGWNPRDWRLKRWSWPTGHALQQMGRVFKALVIGPFDVRVWDKPMPPPPEGM